MKKLIFLGAAMLLLMATGCSNDENNNGTEPLQKVQFSFTNEDFGEDEALTRATSAAEAKPQTIDLGDCEAEISVESEPAVKTRGALTNANGHYTIRAYQGGMLKGEMKGTFSGGTFTADASSPKSMPLPDGTYEFIAFNDDVVPSGNELTVVKDKAATAMMGTTTELINQYPDQTVNFTMKHVGARLRTQFVCKKDMPENITATLEQTAANVIPTSVAYNPATKAYTSTNGTIAAMANNSPASTEYKYTASVYGKNYSYTSTSDYHYFLPTTEGSKLKLTGISAGTVFWKLLTGAIPQLNATLQMQAGKSYVVKIKLDPSYTYLMSDGTTGKFKDTTFGSGSKTPIALVVKENSGAAQSGIAVALHNANGGNVCIWGPSNKPGNNSYTNYNPTSTDSGYDLTWGSALSYGGIIKGNDTSFPAFYHAGHYAPGVSVTGSNISKWYLPAGGDFDSFSRNLEWGGGSTAYYGWSLGYGNLMDQALTRVGGTGMISTTLAYWVSTEGDNLVPGAYTEAHFRAFWDKGMYCSYNQKANPIIVRPFVRY